MRDIGEIVDYDAHKRIRKPTAKKTIVLNGGLRRIKDKIRDEIEEGIEEWIEEEEKC